MKKTLKMFWYYLTIQNLRWITLLLIHLILIYSIYYNIIPFIILFSVTCIVSYIGLIRNFNTWKQLNLNNEKFLD